MGRKFRVPKTSDCEQWAKVERLRLAGYDFWSGVELEEQVPERLREVDEWIKRNPRHRLRIREFWPND